MSGLIHHKPVKNGKPLQAILSINIDCHGGLEMDHGKSAAKSRAIHFQIKKAEIDVG